MERVGPFFIGPQREGEEMDEIKPGELRVSIRYGGHTVHHLTGEMGMYPSGVLEIIKAVHAALDKAKAISDRTYGVQP